MSPKIEVLGQKKKKKNQMAQKKVTGDLLRCFGGQLATIWPFSGGVPNWHELAYRNINLVYIDIAFRRGVISKYIGTLKFLLFLVP